VSMNNKKQKLELTWIGKENRPKLEPRILLEDPEKSYTAAHRVGENDLFDNRLIFGDNLLALKALEQEFTGKVKCIYIDPPFNTQQAFDHYDDAQEHSIWLSLMQDRVHIFRKLLSENGILFVHLSADELFHFKLMCDDIFGNKNFLQLVTIKSASTASFRSINTCPVTITEYILIYVKDKSVYKEPMQYIPVKYSEDYGSYIINKHENPSEWKIVSLTDIIYEQNGFSSWKEAKKAWGDHWKVVRNLAMEKFANEHPDSVVSLNTLQKPSLAIQEMIDKSKEVRDTVFTHERIGSENIYAYNGRTIAFYSKKIRLIDGKSVISDVLTNLWTDINYLSLGMEGGIDFKNGKKPENLIKRVLEIATNPGDLVLDSFGGSGTTGAVAHKMGRRWIMVELGDHCHTHIIPRLQKVINGDDKGGVTETTGWKGGGGFRYFSLAPSLLEKDRFGNWVINKEYNPAMLAEALCKLEGFTYAPSETHYWQHGYSTERDYIYVTTQTLTHEQLQALSDEVGADASLLVLCGAFRGKAEEFGNLTVKKIPKHVLDRCEWGHDDYSLKVENLPQAPQPAPAPLGGLFEEANTTEGETL
jgi:adenine-specific DNA-methyltransferase